VSGPASRRRWRDVDGIVLLDKPPGMSSNQALQRVRRCLLAAKGGHAGTLDPLATGMLPLGFGQATKACGQLLGSSKCYRATLRLGAATDTGDAEGGIIRESPVPALDDRLVESVLAGFVGDRQQVPPMYSALKRGGVPLYELARRGEEVEREPREVEILALERLAFEPGERAMLELRVRASKGTYVRTLAEDIGEVLQCGAHVAALRRTQAGPFELAQAVTFERLEQLRDQRDFEGLDALLLPCDAAVGHLPEVRVGESGCFYLAQGQAVMVAGVPASGVVRIAGPGGEFRGIGEITDDCRVAPRRMMAAHGAR
jgi:tRNA pseudouridine55 synthase